MVNMKAIREVGRRIGEEFHPQRVLLFGSYARGTANADSDVDLLIIMSYEGDWADQSCKIRELIGSPFPMDVLVRRPAEVAKRLKMGDCFMEEVLQQGKVLYEAPDCRMGRGGRRGLHHAPARDARPKEPCVRGRVLSRAAVR